MHRTSNSPAHPDTPRKQHLARFLAEVWDAGDAQACATYIAPAYTIFHDPGDPWDGQTLDLAGYTQRLLVSRAPFPDQRFLIRGLFEDGDSVLVTWAWQATHLGDIPGFPATGASITMSGITEYRFAGEQLCGHWQVVDRLGVFQQLQGARRAPSAT